MKFSKPSLSLCIAWAMLSALSPGHAAQQIVQKQTEGESVELTNLDEPDLGTVAAAPADTAAGQADTAGSVAPQTSASPDAKDGSTAEAPASVAKKDTATTPMEKYRDAKLLQAATPNGVNPASARRYLKVDRASYLESSGLQ